MDNLEFRNGMILPSLILQLKSILEQYPDDGQILKEIIQNAEDAGAKKVIFFMDHTIYGTAQSKLHHNDLAKYQGPALYAYNDAVFTDKDWQGIRRLHDSIKADDPLKVGRFGLGFKSVFHITDLPSIYSGHCIGFLDPHKRFFETLIPGISTPEKTSSYSWDFRIPKQRKEILKLTDQFQPFKQTLFNSQNSFDNGFYNGTMFRFPLRNLDMPSDLTKNCYNHNNIKHLLKALEVESHMILLFLKNIETIEFHEKRENGLEEKLIEINISDLCKELTRNKRQKLINMITNNVSIWNTTKSVSITYPLIVDVSIKNRVKTSSNWLISQYFAGSDNKPKTNEIISGYLPLVGIAIKVDSNSLLQTSAPYGQIFCFLPLPLEEESPTGFYFHVHGSFAVDQNRRHLKWITVDQNINTISDKDLIWNNFLISNVLPSCLSSLIQFLINWHSKITFTSIPFLSDYLDSNRSKLAAYVYFLMPNKLSINSHWRILVEQFYQNLLTKMKFFSCRNQTWMNVNKLRFLPVMDKTKSRIILNIMCIDKKEISDIPEHLINSFSLYNQILTPNDVCSSYKHSQFEMTLEESDKVVLLQYFIEEQIDVNNLIGIKLLPLSDSTWICFENKCIGKEVYIPNDKYDVKKLFPTLQKKFLALEKAPQALTDLTLTQLVHLEKENFAHLINEMFKTADNNDFTNLNTEKWFTIDWLNMVWKHIRQDFPQNLSLFHNLPLLPVHNNVNRLHIQQAVIGISKKDHVAHEFTSICKNLELSCVDRDSQEIYSHVSLLDKYILPPKFMNLVKLLINEQLQLAKDKFKFLSPKDLDSFVYKIANETSSLSLSKSEILLLVNLPIFPTIENSGKQFKTYVSLQEVNEAPAFLLDAPVPTCKMLLEIKNDVVKTLAKKLNVKFIDKKIVIEEYYLHSIKSKNKFYKKNEIQLLIQYACKNFKFWQSDTRIFLQNYEFVTKEDGSWVSPSNLFDPNETDLMELLNKKHFPAGEWNNLIYKDALQALGLKLSYHLTVENCIEIAESFALGDKHTQKFEIFMNILNKNSHLLQRNLKSNLFAVEWVPIKQNKPSNYPKFLNYEGLDTNQTLAKACEVYANKFEMLIGSVAFIVDSNKWNNLEKFFNWSANPSIDLVINHLKKLIDSYKPAEKLNMLIILYEIYKYLNSQSKQQINEHLFDDMKWIWNGENFSKKEDVVTGGSCYSPYYHSIPSEMQKYKNLWNMCNINQNVDLKTVLSKMKKFHEQNEYIEKERVNQDLDLAVRVLNEMVGKKSVTDTNDIFIPVKTCGVNKLKMELLNNCVFCDKTWYKHGFDAEDLGDNLCLIHERIPISTAEKLQIPSLINKYLNAEELDCEFGQTEPLTTRINNLLKDYTDGLAIFKELIQNADDAEATEISFVYDERQNENSRAILFDENMKDLQGPSLWCHNNSLFKDEDFDNITKLGGATKETIKNKIGKFGLGFNAVYHLTEVPMFVSQRYIVFFDPQKKYLGKALLNKSSPGIRLNLKTHKNRIQRLKDQFMPFNNLFGCDFNENSVMTEYQGTLFRFPLRTKNQASTSSLCKKHYNSMEVVQLLNCLYNLGENLLMFTQNVKKINLFHIKDSTEAPVNMNFLFRIEKSILNHFSFYNKSENVFTFMEAALHYEKNLSHCLDNNYLEFSYIIKILTNYDAKIETILNLTLENYKVTTYWIVSWCVDCSDNNKNDSLLPIGAVAGSILLQMDGSYMMKEQNNNSYIYCFLPFSLPSNFPVHINGFFALNSSRTHMYESNDKDKNDPRSQWNEFLLQGPIASAYCCMLLHLAKLTNSDIHNFFPILNNLNGCFSLLTESVYAQLFKNNYTICKSITNNNFYSISESLTKHLDLKNQNLSNNILLTIKHLASNNGSNLIQLPLEIINSILVSKQRENFNKCLIKIDSFYSDWFLPNLSMCPPKLRDIVIIETIIDPQLNIYISSEPCIPVTPSGNKFNTIQNLIDPESKLSVLYEESEERFPYISDLNSNFKFEYLKKLKEFGLANQLITCQEIVDRCYSIERKPEFVHTRLPMILDLIDLKKKNNEIFEFIEKIKTIKMFLPLAQPDNWIFNWKVPKFPLVSINNSYLESRMKLVAPYFFILDEKKCFTPAQQDLKYLFDLFNKTISFDILLNMLSQALKHFESEDDYILKNSSSQIFFDGFFKEFYSELNKSKNESGFESIISSLKNSNLLLIKKGQGVRNSLMLISPNQCCLVTHEKLLPYLCSYQDVNSHLDEKCLKLLELKNSFQLDDYLNALKKMKLKYNETELDEQNLNLAIRLVNLASDQIKENAEISVSILIPNENNVLCYSDKLLYNNCPWYTNKSEKYSHNKISKNIATKLKLVTVNEDVMTKNKLSTPFGQKEDLIDRINTLLGSYCLTEDIFKEMLQNADDSGATEIHFIKDTRQLGTEKIFDESWKPLQGPSLSVYNNKSFTKQDLKGIQKLGRGSKQSDILKTGQFGVGFNTVYQLTDVPSFITTIENDDNDKCDNIEISGKIVGIFDPNCSFLPQSTKENPGGLYCFEELFERYTDVYTGYMQNYQQYNIESGGTFFRLPLRNEASKQKSNIKQKTVSLKDLNDIFDLFQNEIKCCLIFLKSINSLSLINIGNNFEKVYGVEFNVSDTDRQNKLNFMESIRSTATQLHNRKMKLNDIYHKEILYEAEIKENEKVSRWIIVQRFGFENVRKISSDLIDMYSKGNIPLQPLGGVAFPVDCLESRFSSRIFNFLPLPFKTNIPCHINGHFVMSSEGRRDLINEELQKTFKSEWNELIITQIIIPAYCSLLFYYQKMLQNYHHFDTFNRNLHSTYYKMFPSTSNNVPQMRYFIEEFYKYIHKNSKNLFLQYQLPHNTFQITWINSGYEDDTYFDGLEHQIQTWKWEVDNKMELIQCVRNVLVKFGMKLITCPLSIIINFESLNLFIKQITPKSVIQNILKQNYLDHPTPVKNTNFGDKINLVKFLKYLTHEEQDKKFLYELPLLLSADEVLCKVNPTNALFQSKYQELIPHKQRQFVHSEVETFFSSYEQIIKKLMINDFKTMLSDFKPLEVHTSQECKLSDFEVHFASYGKIENWIKSIWFYLLGIYKQDCKYDKENFKKCVDIIKDFCILPVIKNGEKWLFPLSKRLCVMTEKLGMNTNETNLYKILKIIGVPILHYIMENPLNFLVGSTSNPLSVIEALEYVFQNAGLITNEVDDCLIILKYISNHSEMVKTNISRIRNLPIFYDKNTSVCQLKSKQTYVISRDIPTYKKDCIDPLDKYVFLDENNLLAELYQNLNIETCDFANFYIKFVFPNFQLFNYDEKLLHMKHLKERCLVPHVKQVLLSHLKNVCFLKTNSGEFLETSAFYSRENPLFIIFETNFPSKPYDEREWTDFLAECGLNIILNKNKFIDYAKKVFKSIDGHPVSKLLIDYLTADEQLQADTSFQSEIKSIPFIIPGEINKKYLHVHDAFNQRSYIKISDAKCHSHQHYYWTVCNILPPIFDQKLSDFTKAFQINKLQLSDIVENMKNVYYNVHKMLQQKKHYDESTVRTIDTLNEITPEYLNFLKKQNMNNETLRIISNIPILCTDSTKQFVRPNQCSIDITEKDEILPYIFKLPIKYGAYVDLLLQLGATKTVTVKQCVSSLNLLQQTCGEAKLDPNSYEIAKKLLDMFLELLTPESANSIEMLYIPCGKVNTFNKSDEIVCWDLSDYEFNHLNNVIKFNIPILKHKSWQKLEMLSENIKPKRFSALKKDQLHSKGAIKEKPLQITNFEKKIADINFQDGIFSILSNLKSNIAKKMPEFLNKIKIECVDFIELVSLWDDKILENSKRSVDFYPEINCNEILVTDNVEKLERKFSRFLARKCGITKISDEMLIQQIVQSDLENITYLLENFNIEANFREVKPTLGMEISEDLHHTLKLDIFIFHNKQLVAYEVDDPLDRNEDGEPKLILVEIIGLVNDEFPNMSSQYKINFGEHTDTVPATKLYSFRMSEDNNSTEIEMVPLNPQGCQKNSIKNDSDEEIIKDLKSKLEEIWKLDEDAKKKAIKRLLLRWHPDKNSGNMEQCTEIFKHLIILIKMLEENTNIENYNRFNSNDMNNYPSNSNYFNPDYFERMKTRAKNHNYTQKCSRDFNKKYSKHSSYRHQYNNFFSQFNHVATKKPSEARLWLDQAIHDFNMACNDDGASNQWMCIKYYTASLNSIKAVHCAKDYSKLPIVFNTLMSSSCAIVDKELSEIACQMDNLFQTKEQLEKPEIYKTIKKKKTDDAFAIATQIMNRCEHLVDKYTK